MATDIEKVKFKDRVREWADKLGIDIGPISIRDMTTKWASCSSTGVLTFDVDLLNIPEDLQDYVIVHELLHFRVPNHGRLWKSLMKAHLGDYQERIERLENFHWNV
jgi:predicted metal-dependent hydrolase